MRDGIGLARLPASGYKLWLASARTSTLCDEVRAVPGHRNSWPTAVAPREILSTSPWPLRFTSSLSRVEGGHLAHSVSPVAAVSSFQLIRVPELVVTGVFLNRSISASRNRTSVTGVVIAS